MLWPEDMPADKTLIVLSAHDDLVPVALVARQLEAADAEEVGGPRARVLLHPTAGHGGFLVDAPFQVTFSMSSIVSQTHRAQAMAEPR